MGTFADEDQELDLPPSWVASSLRPACECTFVFQSVHHRLQLWFFWAAREQSVPGFQPCNSKDSATHCKKHPGSINKQESKAKQSAFVPSSESCKASPSLLVKAGMKVSALSSCACKHYLVMFFSAGDGIQKLPFPFHSNFRGCQSLVGHYYMPGTLLATFLYIISIYFFFNFKKLLVGMATERRLNSRPLMIIHM